MSWMRMLRDNDKGVSLSSVSQRRQFWGTYEFPDFRKFPHFPLFSGPFEVSRFAQIHGLFQEFSPHFQEFWVVLTSISAHLRGRFLKCSEWARK